MGKGCCQHGPADLGKGVTMLTSKEADDIRQNGGRVRTLFYDCQTCKRSYKTTVPATRWDKKTSRVAMKECSQCDRERNNAYRA